MHLLIIEDDPISALLLKTMLSEHEVAGAASGEAGLEYAAERAPDLVILDINLPGIDGYETCERLHAIKGCAQLPVIFLSNYHALEDRLRAYGSGGSDYLSKPYDIEELRLRIDRQLSVARTMRSTRRDLRAVGNLLMDAQKQAARLQSVSRFIQSSLSVHDLDTLGEQIARAAREIGLDAVLKVSSAYGVCYLSANGDISKLEYEILERAESVRRIHSFGNNRAIFRWSNVILLVRNLNDLADVVAALMDAIDAAIRSIDSEQQLLERLELLESRGTFARDRVGDLMASMRVEIKQAVLSLGLVAALDADDEDRINDILDAYGQRIAGELRKLQENNEAIRHQVAEMRRNPDSGAPPKVSSAAGGPRFGD